MIRTDARLRSPTLQKFLSWVRKPDMISNTIHLIAIAPFKRRFDSDRSDSMTAPSDEPRSLCLRKIALLARNAITVTKRDLNR